MLLSLSRVAFNSVFSPLPWNLLGTEAPPLSVQGGLLLVAHAGKRSLASACGNCRIHRMYRIGVVLVLVLWEVLPGPTGRASLSQRVCIGRPGSMVQRETLEANLDKTLRSMPHYSLTDPHAQLLLLETSFAKGPLCIRSFGVHRPLRGLCFRSQLRCSAKPVRSRMASNLTATTTQACVADYFGNCDMC